MSNEPRDQAEQESLALLVIQRAIDDSWPDGRRRPQLKRVMEDRFASLRRRGFETLAALRLVDMQLYDRFVAGCVKAMRRDGLIASGQLGQSELREMKSRALARENGATFADVAEDFHQEFLPTGTDGRDPRFP